MTDTDALFAAEVQSFLQRISGFYWRSISGLKLGSPLPGVSESRSSSPPTPVSQPRLCWSCPARKNRRDIPGSYRDVAKSLRRNFLMLGRRPPNFLRESLVANIQYPCCDARDSVRSRTRPVRVAGRALNVCRRASERESTDFDAIAMRIFRASSPVGRHRTPCLARILSDMHALLGQEVQLKSCGPNDDNNR